jgi:Tannase and feruloyl esterase
VNASSADLSTFRSRGGKILMYSRWADPTGPPMDAVNYYKGVEEPTGGRRSTESFFRLFMVPGMAHCGGGPGPNILGGFGPSAPVSPEIKVDPQHDVLSPLVQWVERALRPSNHRVTRKRWPRGSHSPDLFLSKGRPLERLGEPRRWQELHVCRTSEPIAQSGDQKLANQLSHKPSWDVLSFSLGVPPKIVRQARLYFLASVRVAYDVLCSYAVR